MGFFHGSCLGSTHLLESRFVHVTKFGKFLVITSSYALSAPISFSSFSGTPMTEMFICLFICFNSPLGLWDSVHFLKSIFLCCLDWLLKLGKLFPQVQWFYPLSSPCYNWAHPVSFSKFSAIIFFSSLIFIWFSFCNSVYLLSFCNCFCYWLLKHFYNSYLKILIGKFQHLIHLSVNVSSLSFLTQVVIFLVLGMTGDVFYCTLDILSIVLGDSGSYLNL